TKQGKAPEIPGEGGRSGGQQINRQRDKEQLLATETVRQPAKENGPRNRAGEIGAAGEANVGVAELEDRALLQSAGERPHQGDFETVENPGDAEGGNDQRLEAAPRQAVEASGNVRFDDRTGRILGHPVTPHRSSLILGVIAAAAHRPGPAPCRPCWQRNFIAALPVPRRALSRCRTRTQGPAERQQQRARGELIARVGSASLAAPTWRAGGAGAWRR